MESRLKGQHYDYCHFTYKNRMNHWNCCCNFIKEYLEFQKTKKKAQKNLKYDANAKASN